MRADNLLIIKKGLPVFMASKLVFDEIHEYKNFLDLIKY